jgi:hypothetical protein
MPSPSCHGATHPFTSNIDNKRKVVKKLRARLSLPILAGPSLQLPNSITTTPEPAAAVASREVVVVPPPSLSRRCINKPIKAKAKPHCLLPLPCFSLVVRPRPPLQACAFRLVAVVIVEMDGGVGVGAAEGGGGGGVEAAGRRWRLADERCDPRALETNYVRRFHRHEPRDHQCSSAVAKHIKAPVHVVSASKPLPFDDSAEPTVFAGPACCVLCFLAARILPGRSAVATRPDRLLGFLLF